MVAMGLTISVAQQLGYEPRTRDLRLILSSIKREKDKRPFTELEDLGFQTDVLAALSDAGE